MSRRKKRLPHEWRAVKDSSTAAGESMNGINVGLFPYEWRCVCTKCGAMKVVTRISREIAVDELLTAGTGRGLCRRTEELEGPAWVPTEARNIRVES